MAVSRTINTERREDLACDAPCIDLNSVRKAQDVLVGFGRLEEVAAFFNAFGDPTRLRLLVALLHTRLCTCDLAAVLGVSESAVSHQLRFLKALRLVASKREGKFVYHELADEHVRRVIEMAETHLGAR